MSNITRTLPVKLTESEVAAKSEQLAAKVEELGDHDKRKKDEAAKAKTQTMVSARRFATNRMALGPLSRK